MIQIFLDGLPAIPKENQSVKFTTENPYFTKSASYTYDIELPLDVPQNRRIFGHIQRMDQTKEQRTLPAVLMVDNVRLLTGTAHITSVTETAVKVQLLGEAASYNYGNKMEDTYIDALDLGDWFHTTWPEEDNFDIFTDYEYLLKKGTTEAVFRHAFWKDTQGGKTDLKDCAFYGGSYPWVAFPVINSSAGVRCNEVAYRFADDDKTVLKAFFRSVQGGGPGPYPKDNPPIDAGAIQPFVWLMAEKIAAATGFTLTKEDNALYTNPFYRRIFIVNANNMLDCNKCLPHWTVNEWWTQIENTFGLILSVDYAAGKMALRERAVHYREVAPTVALRDVVDEYTVEMEDETQADISAGNVGFADFDNDPADLLDEHITGSCRVNSDFANITELRTWALAQPDMTAYKDTLFKCGDGRHFIYTEAEGLVEVNQFRPRRVDDKDDIDVELKFVPARFVADDCNIYKEKQVIVGNYAGIIGVAYIKEEVIGSFPVKILQVPDIAEMNWYRKADYNGLDIEAVINGEEEETDPADDKPDVIYLAIFPVGNGDIINGTTPLTTGGSYTGTIWHPRPFLRPRVTAPLTAPQPHTEDIVFSLSLIPVTGIRNLASDTIAGSVAIDTKARQCIRFVADSIPDPGAIFLIHNRRFVCEKIEADISTDGLQKLMTGYFYEISI